MDLKLRPQKQWGWLVAFYLFIAGAGAGAYLTGAVAGFLGPAWDSVARAGVLIGWPAVFIGSILLILDLGTPRNFWRAWMRPGTSWMARGTLIISTFMLFSFLHIVLWIWPWQVLATNAPLRYLISLLGMLFAVATMAYTGILLGAARPIAFWSTAMLPLLFTVSAASTGIMAVILATVLSGAQNLPFVALERVDIVLVVLEAFVLLLYLQGTHRVPESRASARMALTGELAPLFWFGVVLLGILAPLVLELIGSFGSHGGGAMALAVVASVCGLVGGLLLRQLVLAAGIQAPLKAGRFEYVLQNP
jgi:formate-dependent nitrite reductase membrane component NrfD